MKIHANVTAVALCTMLSTTSHAAWYAHLNLGVGDVHVQKKLAYNVTQAGFTSAYRGFQGQLGLGYDMPIKHAWHLAIEGNFDGISSESQYYVNNWFLSIPAFASERLEYAWSLFLLPGYQLHERVQVFLGPGISTGQFKADSAGSTGGNIGLSGRQSHWLSGWALKAGVAVTCTDALDFLLTYQYAGYKRATYTHVEPLSESVLHARYQPDASAALIGLKYTFDRPMVVSMK